MKRWIFSFLALSLTITLSRQSKASEYWMKIQANNKYDRSKIANTGASIETVKDDYVIAYGTETELKKIKSLGLLKAASDLSLEPMDFPSQDQAYHNYSELTSELQTLVQNNSDIAQMSSIAKTIEGRDIWAIRISKDFSNANTKPAALFMGGHHAREHLSIEVPFLFIKYLLEQYKANNERIVSLINNRDIHIIPMVNPDGAEYDISSSQYKMWRKNRSRNSDGTSGVDLNRNYGFQWGTGGSSKNPSSETYMGPNAFSEIESQAIKNYVDAHANITTLLSFHTYSQLILYPWGHKYDSISDTKDFSVYKTMAQKMSEWNGYTPEQSSELYIASGDTTDWSYGVHKIFSFTFELDPSASEWGGGGFYPGASVIQPVFQKNIEPCLYLIDLADNPYRAINIGIGL